MRINSAGMYIILAGLALFLATLALGAVQNAPGDFTQDIVSTPNVYIK